MNSHANCWPDTCISATITTPSKVRHEVTTTFFEALMRDGGAGRPSVL